MFKHNLVSLRKIVVCHSPPPQGTRLEEAQTSDYCYVATLKGLGIKGDNC